jgi:L,D-peptidoglycan transpeptidase YkuD (ErfK/YbiS/YcfS/YnhG family)
MSETYIAKVVVDLAKQEVTLEWTGPDAAKKEKGPFKCSPGKGKAGVDCDDVETSKKSGTLCTPKGDFKVIRHEKAFASSPNAKWVTRFQSDARGIALHYYPTVPDYPASSGCVRIKSLEAAKLIHDNTKAKVSVVSVSGKLKKKPK